MTPFDFDLNDRRAEYVENGGEVMRCHTFPTLRPQTVGAHSFAVAWWCVELTSGAVRAKLLMAALTHDLPEAPFGDMPAPAKRLMSTMARAALDAAENDSLTAVGIPLYHDHLEGMELLVLKLADYLELLAYTVREMDLGNRHRTLILCFENAGTYVKELLTSGSLPAAVYNRARDHYERLTSKGNNHVGK